MPAKKKSPATGRVKRTAPTAPAAAARVDLFDRVAAILDQAQADLVRAVNTRIVPAYWLIGREIVEEGRAAGKTVHFDRFFYENLSRELTERFGKGFSAANIRIFEIFYRVYEERFSEIQQTRSGESGSTETGRSIVEDLERSTPPGQEPRGFLPQLGWGHYRELMRVDNQNERYFYEIQAAKEGWDVRHLRQQIQTCLFARLLKSRKKADVKDAPRKYMDFGRWFDSIRSPYLLDFLGLPPAVTMYESDLESAMISNLQTFLLELGRGFAFVTRQMRLEYADDFHHIDLVFYHIILKCHVLIDLKIGKLTHEEVKRMDSCVSYYDMIPSYADDNPTIGLILGSDKCSTVVRYFVPHESRDRHVGKYAPHVPTVDELRREIERVRRLLEEWLEVQADR